MSTESLIARSDPPKSLINATVTINVINALDAGGWTDVGSFEVAAISLAARYGRWSLKYPTFAFACFHLFMWLTCLAALC